MYYLLIFLILVLPVRIQDKYGRTLGYSQQQGQRTYYYNKYYQKQFSTQQRGKSIIIYGKNK